MPERPTGTKTYRCARFPSLGIATDVVFKDGVFTTSGPHLQFVVEINPWFGRDVFLDGQECQPRREGQRVPS